MTMLPKIIKRGPKIDTSELMISKKHKEADRTYLDSFDGATCMCCGIQDGTVVGCHVRKGWFGGASKPHDYLAYPGCNKCHRLQEKMGEVKFWEMHGYTIKQIKKVLRSRYETWSKSNG